MKKWYIFIGILIFLISFVSAYSLGRLYKDSTSISVSTGNGGQEKPNPNDQEGEGMKDTDSSKEEDKTNQIKEQISKMSLDEKLGQMLIVNIEGYSYEGNTKDMVEKYKVGGFIAFSQNIKDPKQLLGLINSIKEGNKINKIPLFMSIDEEGGRVTRMPKELKNIPTSRNIGQVNNENYAFELGSVTGDKIKSFGFNMDFAPVLDVYSNPKNTVIGDRSFGQDAEVVSRLGIKTMKGIQIQNVVPVVKHFPGHGDTTVDSHLGLPTVYNDLNRLQSLELKPFKAAIDNGADAVMIAHILLPKIDEQNPSSMSKAIITDILRNQLKFNGVVITDDMTMGAIMKNYKIGEAAVKSVAAGADIILVCHGYENQMEVIKALKNAVIKGEISESRIDESVFRILSLKEKYKLKDEAIKQVDIDGINKRINRVLNFYGNSK